MTLKPAHWTLISAAALSLTLVARGAAETRTSPAQSPPSEAKAAQPTSTTAGVYSEEQAKRGEETYMTICVACHPAGTYTGASFKTTWAGKQVSDLFEFLSKKMPEDAPGSLSAKEYAQVIAYILKSNKLPAGKTELPGDPEALKGIRLELDVK